MNEDVKDLEEKVELAFCQIQSAADFLRGAQLDPAIPPHFKEAMRCKMEELDAVVSELSDVIDL